MRRADNKIGNGTLRNVSSTACASGPCATSSADDEFAALAEAESAQV